MINTLDDYLCNSIPLWGDFTTNPNLRKKVDEGGNLLPFVGNTVTSTSKLIYSVANFRRDHAEGER